MGSAVYKLFESSLISNLKNDLLSYREIIDPFSNQVYNIHHLRKSLKLDGLWLLDKNFNFINNSHPPHKISISDLKKQGFSIVKKGEFLPTYKKIYALIPMKGSKVFLLICKNLNPLNQNLRHLRKLILYIVIITSVLILFLLNVLLKASITKPLDMMIKNIEEIKSGQRKKMEGPYLKEFKYLINSFNELLKLIDQQRDLLNHKIEELRKLNQTISEYHEEMAKFEKLVSIGELSAGIAHEIGNPLNNIIGYLKLIQYHCDISKDSNLFDFITRIKTDAMRMDSIVKNILDFTRKDEPLNVSFVNVLEEIDKTLELVLLKLHDKDIQIVKDYTKEEAVFVKIDSKRFQQVLLNLLNNAIDSIEKKGSIKISLKINPNLTYAQKKFFDVRSQKGTNNFVSIAIEDNGEGIRAADLPHVFDPFFTTKDPGRGTGLGLSVSLNLIREMGGTISLKSRKGKGTIAEVLLPYDH